MNVPQQIFQEFNLDGELEFLTGGEGRVFRVGNVIVKHINNDSIEYTKWTADFFNSIKENGFRVAKPISTKSGEWITLDGWSAWQVVEGNHEFETHVEESIKAIIAFHSAIKDYPKPSFLNNDNPYMRADYYAWNEKPTVIKPEVKEDVDLLYDLRKPIEGYQEQLIHGDLNPSNILVSDTLPPAIIDIAPYWRAPEFALAIYAYWIGPWRSHKERLQYFKDIPNFKQMLVRAAIRMLLIQSEFNKFPDLEKHRQAAKIIKEFLIS